jgi:hypothetical protein
MVKAAAPAMTATQPRSSELLVTMKRHAQTVARMVGKMTFAIMVASRVLSDGLDHRDHEDHGDGGEQGKSGALHQKTPRS